MALYKSNNQMFQEEKNPFSQSYPMIGGDGPHSYFKNSQYQREVIDTAKGFMNEGISTSLDLRNPRRNLDSNPIRIADFGCSIGPNTFIAVQNIIEAVKLKYQKAKHQNGEGDHLEFHVFFNDHTNNDFNMLFKSLSPVREYCAAGAPGSFYGRVLPKDSLHIGHTSYTLHWLSEAPPETSDRNSKAWNGNSIYCSNLVKEVTEAYSAQFMRDMDAFLCARAQEIVPGGLMVVLGHCLPDTVLMAQVLKGVVTGIVGSCLIDMAKLGLIGEEKVESFNLPIYFPHITELKESIERNGSFSIEKLEKFRHPMDDMPQSVEFISSTYRAIYHGVIEESFGKGMGDELFENHLEKRLREYPSKFEDCDKDMQYFILLKRKDY